MDGKKPRSVQYPQLSRIQVYTQRLVSITKMLALAASLYWIGIGGGMEAIIVFIISLGIFLETLYS